MKKLLYLTAVLAMLMTMTSCSFKNKNPGIGEPAASKYIDKNTHKPIVTATTFRQGDPVIYFTVKTMDFPANAQLKAVWKYLTDGTELPSEVTTSGTGYEAFSLKKNSGTFPAGEYEVTVSAVVNGQLLEIKGRFEILPEVSAAHLLNPVTSKAIESDETLNPVSITSQFTQDDPVIYFVLQSKDLPGNTKINCEWVYKDTGDVILSDIITDGTRNIAFNLKPDEGRKLPSGNYLVTASAVIDNQVESVSKEFEIK